ASRLRGRSRSRGHGRGGTTDPQAPARPPPQNRMPRCNRRTWHRRRARRILASETASTGAGRRRLSVYPANFEYFAPASLDEAFEIIGRYDEGEAKVLAGGMDLIPAMNLQTHHPAR